MNTNNHNYDKARHQAEIKHIQANRTAGIPVVRYAVVLLVIWLITYIIEQL